MADDGLRPIIIKKSKKTAAGHHGGCLEDCLRRFRYRSDGVFLLM
jgi:hypothetical protein